MLAVAVFFDAAPLLAVFSLMALTYSAISGVGGGACQVAETTSIWMNPFMKLGAQGACKTVQFAAFLGAGMAGVMVGPLLYAMVSLAVSILTVLIFSFWFLMHRVNMWAFKTNRIAVNLISIIVELIPGLDLLPGTTFMVWRHIKISEAEDKKKAEAGAAQMVRTRRGPGQGAVQNFRRMAASTANQEQDTRRVNYPHGPSEKRWQDVYTKVRPQDTRTISDRGAPASTPQARRARPVVQPGGMRTTYNARRTLAPERNLGYAA